MSDQAGHTVKTGWQRVHWLSPLLASKVFLAAVFTIIIWQAQNYLREIYAVLRSGGYNQVLAEYGHWLGWAFAVFVAVFLLVILGLWISWRAMGYQLTAEGVHLRQGVLSKQQRTAQYQRVQSVDINAPLIPRIFGLAELVFDVAGGDGSNITLRYLNRAHAESLRAEIFARVRQAGTPGTIESGGADVAGGSSEAMVAASSGPGGLAGGAPAGGEHYHAAELEHTLIRAESGHSAQPGGNSASQRAAARSAQGASLGARFLAQQGHRLEETGVDFKQSLDSLLAPYVQDSRVREDGQLIRVPITRLLASHFLRMEVVIVIVATFLSAVLVVGIAIYTRSWWLLGSGAPPVLIAVGTLLSPALNLANFTVRLAPEGLRVSQGLFSLKRRTIPLDRIQGVELSQSLLWRTGGWWRVSFTTAAGVGDFGELAAAHTLLPVGSVDDVMVLLGLVLPDPQPQAGVRARDLMLTAMYGSAAQEDGTPSYTAPAWTVPAFIHAESSFAGRPRESKWLNCLSWRRRAHAVTGTMLIVRSGRWSRRVLCVPHARVQSMRLKQGPLQRMLDLAQVRLDITPGPVQARVAHVPTGSAREFLAAHNRRCQIARKELDDAGSLQTAQVCRVD